MKDSYGNAIPSPVWEKVGEFTTDASTGIYQIRTVMREGASEAQSLRPYSFHDADGHEQFGSDGSESYGWRYRVAETAAPEGYRRIYELYEFGISDIPSYVAPYNYLNNDTVTIVNKPVPQETETEIVGKKILRGRDLKDREFAFTMTPEENVGAAWGEEYPGGFGESLTVRNDEAGYFRFPLSYTYDDYTKAVEKGFVDENRCACFYSVVRERVPEAAIDGFLNGVRYDASVYLVTVRLFIDGDRLRTEIGSGPYDPNRLTGDHFALLAPERRRNLPGL